MIEILIPGRSPLAVDQRVADFNGTLAVNGRLLLECAALGIVVVQGEGAAVETLLRADVAVPDVDTALALLEHPQRLVATLRA